MNAARVAELERCLRTRSSLPSIPTCTSTDIVAIAGSAYIGFCGDWSRLVCQPDRIDVKPMRDDNKKRFRLECAWSATKITLIAQNSDHQNSDTKPHIFGGTIVPYCICRRERKFQRANVPRSESSEERKFQGAKIPGIKSSTPGTFAPVSKWSWERKVHNSSRTWPTNQTNNVTT